MSYERSGVNLMDWCALTPEGVQRVGHVRNIVQRRSHATNRHHRTKWVLSMNIGSFVLPLRLTIAGRNTARKACISFEAERQSIAEESLESDASVAVVARSHGVNANQVFHWRKLLREGRLGAKPT